MSQRIRQPVWASTRPLKFAITQSYLPVPRMYSRHDKYKYNPSPGPAYAAPGISSHNFHLLKIWVCSWNSLNGFLFSSYSRCQSSGEPAHDFYFYPVMNRRQPVISGVLVSATSTQFFSRACCHFCTGASFWFNCSRPSYNSCRVAGGNGSRAALQNFSGRNSIGIHGFI